MVAKHPQRKAVAIGHAMRKLLHLAFALWKSGKPFDPEFPDAFLKDVRDQALFDNLGTTSSEIKVNEASKTADVTLIFDGTPAKDPRRKRLGEQP